MIISKIIAFLSKIFLFTGKIGSTPLFDKKLSKEDEKKYFTRIKIAKSLGKPDAEAEEILVKHNLRLVAHIAKRFKSDFEDQDDLISIGSIGLIKAVRNYDLNQQTSFSSFASRCISNEILMVLRSEKKLTGDVSLNLPLGTDSEGNELSILDTLFDSAPPLEDSVSTKVETEKINKLAKKLLDPREYEILSLRFGLNTKTPLTQNEVAKILNISRSYVSRIEKIALKKIKDNLKNKS